ncbi:MAG TPA: serine hydrolase [Gemmatimonadales bacterium]
MRPQWRRPVLPASLAVALLAGVAAAQQPYYPPPGRWERRAPQAVGMDSTRLAQAVAFALASEIRIATDLRLYLESRFVADPYGELLGPMKDRGAANGLVIRHGYVVAQWGDIERVDMTFSVSKSYLSAVAGLAFDRGLIRDPHDRVGDYVDDGGFDGPHNGPITWHMLLNQTNEWEGTLWDKPDVADRRRGRDRTLSPPGTFWEYNDVRVNRTALALLRVWREPLAEVLRREIMHPVGASDTWEWHGYRNSWVEVDGRRMQSVSGGGHWGGGVWASTLDHARFGLLFLRRGVWAGSRILSERWIAAMTTPTDIAPDYGYMWWLNTGRRMYPHAPASAFFARGGGGNIIWVDPEHDLVAVMRWMDAGAIDGFIERVLAAVRG